MLGVYDSMKKLIDKCDLYFEGHIISKELLLQNYAKFLASNFEKKHNVAISLHTGSICFDIVSILFAAMSNIFYDQSTIDDFIESLEIGDIVINGRERCRFEGIAEPYVAPNGTVIQRIILVNERMDHGDKEEDKTWLPQSKWHQLKPYKGDSKRLDGRGIRSDNKKRNDFLSSVFAIPSNEIPAFIEKSSVIVMNRERSERVIDNLEIEYDGKRIRITEIMPVSYCSENEEYPYGGNPGKIEPSIKITNNISNARSLVTGNWDANEAWIHDVIGVSIIGFGAVSRARTEVSELMGRRKLKYVFVSYNIASEDGETLLAEAEDASVFACTKEYLLNSSLPIKEENPFTLELDKHVESVVNHETTALPVKTFDCDWSAYRKVQIALSRLRHSGARLAEDYVPLAHSVMNLMITAVFPFELMENLVESGSLEVESPLQRIMRLTDMTAEFVGEDKESAQTVLKFLEDGYTKLLSHSPKENALFDLVEKNANKKVAIIVPKAYYANILYNLNILDYFEDESMLCISTANKFDYSQQFDIVIAIGAFWGKKFDPFRCRSASTIYVIVSAVEENLFKYRKKLASKIEYLFNLRAGVPMDAVDIEEEVYSDGATEEEVAEVIGSTIDVSAYINKIFETRSLEILETGNCTHSGTTEISHIATCADGERIFFTKKYRAYVFDSAKEDVIETSVDKLSAGDMVIFKSNGDETKDIVSVLLDKYIEGSDSVNDEVKLSYLKSQYWKLVLKEFQEKNGYSYYDLSNMLEKCGSSKSAAAIRSWIDEDSHIVGPQGAETYAAIAKMTRNEEMLADPASFCIACDKIRRVRVGILKLIAKTIISKYSGRLTEDDDMAKIVSENIDDISVMVQIEAITPVEDKKAPINMVNKPISMN